jgi:ABC-type dipeptide/oligopeptide/nickel transport system ATPase component
MIIQIRGTSGSGKSTIMREVMDSMDEGGCWTPIRVAGRKQPLYYRHVNGSVVLGHYESPCGGCDTIGSAKAVYNLINSHLQQTHTILCEGLLLSEDVKWSSQLPDLHVVFLNTPLAQCLKQIKQRREAAGNSKPLNPANTSNRVGVIERARRKLTDLGVHCLRCTPDQAASVVLNLIKGNR